VKLQRRVQFLHGYSTEFSQRLHREGGTAAASQTFDQLTRGVLLGQVILDLRVYQDVGVE
jgi:hypothetical protein